MNPRGSSAPITQKSIPLILLLAYLVSSVLPLYAEISRTGNYMRGGLGPELTAAIEKFRISIPSTLEEAKVPGAALVLVDDQGILWTEGYGHIGDRSKTPVTPDTLFPIGDISKLVIATAVMAAVQDGLVKLDEPVTAYLPDFRINSRYEEHPERKITLRKLLNCTAGIPSYVSRGNFLEPTSAASFEDHIESLSDSWLICPVGEGYYPSIVSIELAGHIVSTASGKSFRNYLHEKLFSLLGMNRTTADPEKIMADSERAIGNMSGVSKIPALYSGNIYSTVRDMGLFIQLHINRGTVNGRRIIDRSLMEILQTPISIIQTDPEVYFGQGIIIDKRWPERTETILHHSGWVVGFNSFMHWYPEYGIGMIVLTNRLPNSATGVLGLTLTDTLTKEKLLAKRYPDTASSTKRLVSRWQGWPEHQPTPYRTEWKQYHGKHKLRISGYELEWWARFAIFILGKSEYTPRIHVRKKDGYLCITESKAIASLKNRTVVDEKLQEIKPGIFAIKTGETLDFTREVPTWDNFQLK